MKTQHTKGKWSQVINLKKANDYCIHSKGKLICIISQNYPESTDEEEANAKLIAAAPDLLSALQEAKTIVYNVMNNLESRKGIEIQAIFDKAINKATK